MNNKKKIDLLIIFAWNYADNNHKKKKNLKKEVENFNSISTTKVNLINMIPSSKNLIHTNYRPDIDGLRAFQYFL